MRRLSISDKDMFVPEEGEIFFAEIPNKGIDRRVKTLVSKDNNPCKNCVFCSWEFCGLCFYVDCLKGDEQYTFRRVSDGKN